MGKLLSLSAEAHEGNLLAFAHRKLCLLKGQNLELEVGDGWLRIGVAVFNYGIISSAFASDIIFPPSFS